MLLPSGQALAMTVPSSRTVLEGLVRTEEEWMAGR